MSPKTMKAVVTTGRGDSEIKQVPVPRPEADEVLVQVFAAAQNPTDWKTLSLNKQQGNILGCDFAGIVVEIGPSVTEGLRKVGDRVAGGVHGGVRANGAFAEYVVVPAELIFVLPDDMTFEQAAQLGIACITACQCLYQCLHLPTPFAPASSPTDVLIWSGTSSTGQFAVQLAKLAGLRVLSTSSPKHFDLVKSLGADEVFDYADSWTARKILASTGGKLKYAVDCISEGMTPVQVSSSLSSEGGEVATLLPYQSRKKGVNTQFVLAYSIFAKDIQFPFNFPANPEHFENAINYSSMISELLARNMLTLNPIKLFPHGLASVPEGFDYMKLGKVHAEKITYKIADTPGIGDQE